MEACLSSLSCITGWGANSPIHFLLWLDHPFNVQKYEACTFLNGIFSNLSVFFKNNFWLFLPFFPYFCEQTLIFSCFLLSLLKNHNLVKIVATSSFYKKNMKFENTILCYHMERNVFCYTFSSEIVWRFAFMADEQTTGFNVTEYVVTALF